LTLILQINTSSFFTKSLIKHPEVTAAPNQALSFAEDFGKAVLKLIQTKTIIAIGMVTPGSITKQYLFDPMIRHDLSGAPTFIMGNSLNNKAEFSLVKIKIASFCFFLLHQPKKDFDPFWCMAKS
jgi:hypothetical protein